MVEWYCIKATFRYTGEVDIIKSPMTYEKAIEWEPTELTKRHYKDFKVCKYKEVNKKNVKQLNLFEA